MRTLDFKSTTRVLVRFRSTRAIETEGSSKAKLPHPPSTSFSSHICSLDSSAPPTAPFTPLSPLIVPEVIGVLAGPEAGGVPPYAAAYPISRHRKPLPAHSRRYTNDIPLRQKDKSEQTGLVPPSPQQLWTRAFTLASKDVKNVTSKALVYFLERGKAHYRPWVPPTLQTRESLGKNGDTGLSATIGTSESARVVPPVLQYSVRLTLSHYTALIHGLLLRRHYSVALEWVRKLIYPFPSTFSPRASALFPNTNSILLSRTTKHPRDAVHFALDGPALSACLVVLARLGRVHEAVKVLEAYAAPTMIARKSRHASNVQMNTIQMNDFLLVLLRWPSKKHALPVPSVQFPLKPLKVKRTRRPAASEGRTDTSVEHLSVSTGTTRSARPDLLLRLLPALYPRYGVTWDARTVCLMLQAVRMSAKMDGVSAFGLRKVLKEMFVGRGLLHPREPPMMESRSLAAQSLREDSKQWWFVERIMEVLWKPVDSETSSPTPKSSSKKVKLKQKSPEPRHGSSLQPLEYIPFTPWPWPISRPRDKALSNPALDRPDSSDENGPFAGEVEQRSGSAAVSFSRNIREGEIHPFLLAREIFLRLIWAHAENLNEEARNLTVSTYINLHNLDPPATLPPHSLSRLMDPDGDGLGHLSGVPKWFGALEGALKRRFGFGLGDGLGVASGFGFSSTVDSEGREMAPSRAEAVDEVFGYPKDSIPLPRLTPTAFHHYILLLGLSAPEPWEFTQAGWRQRHPFEGYPLQGSASPPEPSASSASKSAASSGPFTGCTSTTSSGNRFQAKTLIPGPAEIPVALAYMRALRLIPTRDTICAAVVFWKEAVGGETLFDLGLRDIREYRDARRNVHTSEAGDAYVDEFEEWKASVENIGSGDISERSISGGRRGVQVGEYARFCRWIREWVDEVNANLSEDVKGGLKMTMPHPYHIHRWTGIVRKMREGQGYEEGEREAEEEEEKEDESRKDGKAGGAS